MPMVKIPLSSFILNSCTCDENAIGAFFLPSNTFGCIAKFEAFYNPQAVNHKVMRGLIGGFFRLSPVKKAMMGDVNVAAKNYGRLYSCGFISLPAEQN